MYRGEAMAAIDFAGQAQAFMSAVRKRTILSVYRGGELDTVDTVDQYVKVKVMQTYFASLISSLHANALVAACAVFAAGSATGVLTERCTATDGDIVVKLAAVEKGASATVGYYAPARCKLQSEKPAKITKTPEGVVDAKYAPLPFTHAEAWLMLEESGASLPRLWIDANANGDLTDDPAVVLEKKGGTGNSVVYMGAAGVSLGEADAAWTGWINIFRFDPADPQRAALKDYVMVYRDYARSGEVTLKDKTYRVMLTDDATTGDFRVKEISGEGRAPDVMFMLDINANGTFEQIGEIYRVRDAFKINGATYEVKNMARDGSSFTIGASTKEVEEILPPPDHSVGKKITSFTAQLMGGKEVNFPGDYKGKVVLLDFWATWCGPCVVEMPHVVSAYEKFHDKGFDVLGVSLDREKMEQKIADFSASKKMPWPHVYDGGFWQAKVAKLYGIQSIPATFLVDGETGEILGTNLRGAKLSSAVEAALAKRAAAK